MRIAAQIAEWAPLIIEGRDESQPIAATRIITGTDVGLRRADPPPGRRRCRAAGLRRPLQAAGSWRSTARPTAAGGSRVEDTYDGTRGTVSAGFVFIGAGGGSIELLQKSGHSGGAGLWRLPGERHLAALRRRRRQLAPSRQGLRQGAPAAPRPCRCRISTRASSAASRSLLFGPYAGFSSKFLKHGSLTDLFRSIRPDNIVPLLDVARDNLQLTEYLIGQVLQSRGRRERLKKYTTPQLLHLKRFFARG